MESTTESDQEHACTVESDFGKHLLRNNTYISVLRSSTVTSTVKSMTLRRLQKPGQETIDVDDSDDEQLSNLDSYSGSAEVLGSSVPELVSKSGPGIPDTAHIKDPGSHEGNQKLPPKISGEDFTVCVRRQINPPAEKLVKRYCEGIINDIAAVREYCQKNKIKCLFKEVRKREGQFACHCRIDGKQYEIGLGIKPKDAKADAAKKAFKAILEEFNLESVADESKSIVSADSSGRQLLHSPLNDGLSTSTITSSPKSFMVSHSAPTATVTVVKNDEDDVGIIDLEKDTNIFTPSARRQINPPAGSIRRQINPPADKLVKRFCEGSINAISAVREYCQKNKIKCRFREVRKRDGHFGYHCCLDGIQYELGLGIKKKEAMADAAEKAFKAILEEFNKESDADESKSIVSAGSIGRQLHSPLSDRLDTSTITSSPKSFILSHSAPTATVTVVENDEDDVGIIDLDKDTNIFNLSAQNSGHTLSELNSITSLDVGSFGNLLKHGEDGEKTKSSAIEKVSDRSVVVVDDSDDTENSFDDAIVIDDSTNTFKELDESQDDLIVLDSADESTDSTEDYGAIARQSVKRNHKDVDSDGSISKGVEILSFDDDSEKEQKSTAGKSSTDSSGLENICKQNTNAEPLFFVDRTPSAPNEFLLKTSNMRIGSIKPLGENDGSVDRKKWNRSRKRCLQL